MHVVEAPTRCLHEPSAKADIAFSEPRIHSPGRARRRIEEETRGEAGSALSG
jgi:hypothetical protein